MKVCFTPYSNLVLVCLVVISSSINAQILPVQSNGDTLFVAERPYGSSGIGYWSNDSSRGFVAANGKDGFAADSNDDDGFVAVANGGDGFFASSNAGYAAYLISPSTRLDPAVYIAHDGQNVFDVHFGGDALLKSDDSFHIYLNQQGAGGNENFQIHNQNEDILVSINEDGNATFAGEVCASNITCSSDLRYKRNITPINGALDKLMKIKGVTYYWDRANWPKRNFSTLSQVGFIAQDLEKVLPELVHTDSSGFKSVAYNKMTAVLVEAVKELKEENDELRKENEEIKLKLGELDAIKLRLDQLENQ